MLETLAGYWVGEIEGTNQGGFALTITQNGNQISGSGRFSEPKLGMYEYSFQGTVSYPHVVMTLTPKPNQNPLLSLGNVEVTGTINEQGILKGRWKSTVWAEGVFTAHR